MSPLTELIGSANAYGWGLFNQPIDPAFESISSFAVTSEVNTISFTNIPQTYTSLQVRASTKASTNSGYNGALGLRAQFNGDTGSNYQNNYFYTLQYCCIDSQPATTPETSVGIGLGADGDTGGTMTGNYGVTVCTIPDYSSSNKVKMTKSFEGSDNINVGYYRYQVTSGVWRNLSPITSMVIFLDSTNFKQYSQVALYGIR